MKYNLIFSWLFCLALLWQADAALAQTVAFTGKDAAEVITQALVSEGAGNDIKVSINEARDEDAIAEATTPITANVDGLTIDKAHNRWQAQLLPKAGGRNLAPIRLSGRFDEMTSLPVLKRRIQPGEVIGEEDIDWDRQPTLRLRKNTVTNAHDLIGKSPKHMISQGRAIRMDEIAGPSIVNKGTQVTLLYKSRNIEIKTYGEALESGAKGDVIRVRNLTSKAVIQGTVESYERVRVSSPDSDAAEAM